MNIEIHRRDRRGGTEKKYQSLRKLCVLCVSAVNLNITIFDFKLTHYSKFV
jgi:hypothetical protein